MPERHLTARQAAEWLAKEYGLDRAPDPQILLRARRKGSLRGVYIKGWHFALSELRRWIEERRSRAEPSRSVPT